MKIHWHRTLLWSFFLLALLLATHLVISSSHKTPTLTKKPAWIGLPKYGTDASETAVRQVMFNSLNKVEVESSYEPLAKKCWKYGEEISPETYAITRPRELIPDRATAGWRIELEVQGEQIKVSKWKFPWPALPLEWNEIVDTTEEKSINKSYVGRELFYLPKSKLDVIAKGWKTSAMWNSRQQSTLCFDSYGIQFESCVNGQYGIRDTTCGEPHKDDHEFAEAIYSKILDYKPEP